MKDRDSEIALALVIDALEPWPDPAVRQAEDVLAVEAARAEGVMLLTNDWYEPRDGVRVRHGYHDQFWDALARLYEGWER
jgi:hypothetical protein